MFYETELADAQGSSPLTRGKPEKTRDADNGPRLIPAHAGKTLRDVPFRRVGTAHPRSRGENFLLSDGSKLTSGSSPLTRGKHRRPARDRRRVGLIPAHAGKTPEHAVTKPCAWAHPRSRGENPGGGQPCGPTRGSSPLTRGKLCDSAGEGLAERLIPAHAGKTGQAVVDPRAPRAHPRSRGENGGDLVKHLLHDGSSPLTRGKPRRDRDARGLRGLIPAHAGKTARAPVISSAQAAHPRSRGENTSRPALLLRRSIRSWKPLSLPSPLEVTQFGSLAQLTRRRIRFGVLASSFRVVGAHHECESIEVNGLPGIAPRQEGESLLVARTKDHDSPTRFHVLSDDVPQALAYTGAERPHEDPRGNLHEPPRHVTSQPLGHRGQDQDDHQESLSS